MSKQFRLPLQNVYNKNIQPDANTHNKENCRSTNGGSKMFTAPQANTFATPSEDEFGDDDDDELLIAASQQVERKLANEQATKQPYQHQLQGETAMLRDKLHKLTREKEQLHTAHLQDSKGCEQRYKKELDNLKSKLQFKDRDIDELKTKVQELNRTASPVHQAKRPRLATVKTTRTAALHRQPNQSHRIKGFRSASSVALSNFCSMTITEAGQDADHKTLLSLHKGLKNNATTRRKHNVRRAPQRCHPSPEISTTIQDLFDKASTRPWEDAKLCFDILSILLTYNVYQKLDVEVKRLIKRLQDSSSQYQHDTVCNTIDSSGLNIYTLCARSSSSCPLTSILKYQSDSAISILLRSITADTTLSACVCSDKVVVYVCTMLEEHLEGDTLTPTATIRDHGVVRRCLNLLMALSPFFSDMALRSLTRSTFYGSLDLVNKCDLSHRLSKDVDSLYDVIFDHNNSMSC